MSGKPASGSYWFDIELSNNSYTWTPFDDILDSARAAGVQTIDYCFFQTPQWASSMPNQTCSSTASTGKLGCAAPPKNIGDWENFVTAVVTRYKGIVKYYEPWNEPDAETEWSGTIAQMVQLVQAAYPIIKSIDPNATVLTPSVSIGGALTRTPAADREHVGWHPIWLKEEPPTQMEWLGTVKLAIPEPVCATSTMSLAPVQQSSSVLERPWSTWWTTCARSWQTMDWRKTNHQHWKEATMIM